MSKASSRRCNRVVRNTLWVALCAALYAAAPAAYAQAAASSESIRQYDIPAGSLSSALGAWGAQSDRQVVFAPDLVAGKQTRGASGQYNAEQALTQLLAGTGLGWKRVNGQTYALEKAPPPQPVDTRQERPSNPKASRSTDVQKITTLSAVTVTGTRIRGGITASPTTTITAKQIQNEGFSDLGEVIRSVSQNFNGGQNPGIVGGAEGGGIANQNISGGSSLNLRGLGPDATLTLLNGRRLAYTGFVQAVDIDAIPLDAVDRLEIIPDGASAIYGSDAVGGVGNVILKRDFDGVTLGTRYGGAIDGGLITREYAVTAGTTWSSGGLIATWKKASNDPIYSDQRDYISHLFNPTTLYPQNDLRSGLLSIHQSIGSRVELQVDTFRTRREQLTYYTAIANQFYPATSDTTTSFVSPGIEISLPNDWTASVGGTWGKDDIISGLSIGVRSTGLVTPIARSLYRNEGITYELGAEGPLFVLPGGDARLAVGAGYRRNEFLQSSLVSGTIGTDGDDSSRFAYIEINLPLIGAAQGIAGAQRLALIAAVRGEDYASFGGVATPKIGVIYGPNTDFTLKASWGKSFKAPTLLQRYQTRSAYLYPAAAVGGSGYAQDATVLIPYGGNPDLEPERARTWSASIEFHPEAIPALEAELSWFDIDFTGRVAQPLVYQAEALSNPIYAQFIDYAPTVDEQASIIANSVFSNFTGAPYDPNQVVAIAFNRYANTVAQRLKGLDLSGSYGTDLGLGRLSIRGSLSWLDSSQQTTMADRVHDLSGTLFYPAKIKGRIGATWNQGGFSASTFANYVSGVTNTVDRSKTSSFTTIDATLRYTTGERDGFLSGLGFALSATNLFDRSPPLYTPSSNNPPYDSTNYSPIGRFVSVSVSKHW